MRDWDSSPMGHTTDFAKPDCFTSDEYARALEHSLLLFRNFACAEDCDTDFSVFENGPPDYIADFYASSRRGRCLLVFAESALSLASRMIVCMFVRMERHQFRLTWQAHISLTGALRAVQRSSKRGAGISSNLP